MKWGMTNLIPPQTVCQVYGDIVTKGGEIHHVQLVLVETAPGLVGSASAPASVEWYRVFYSISDEKTNGATPKSGNGEQGGPVAPGSQPGGVEGG